MKRLIIITGLFFAAVAGMFAQDIPACIASMNKQSSFSQREYIGRKTVSQGRTVYMVKSSRPPKCMDCASGVVYYDSTCTSVASFTIGFAPMAFIRQGYLPSDFAEASSPLFAKKLAAATRKLPACISRAISNSDSLIAAGIISVKEVKLGGRDLYYFESAPVKKPGCNDCPSYYSYYDSVCTAARFSIGGVAGVVAPSGFTKQDFLEKKWGRTIWSKPVQPMVASMPFIKQASFAVTESYDTTTLRLFKVNDQLKISAAEGLYHYRNGKLMNRYKIIPQKIQYQKVNPCLIPPCPVSQHEKWVYYLEPLKRFIEINVLTDRAWFNFSKNIAEATPGTPLSKDVDWETKYRLKQTN